MNLKKEKGFTLLEILLVIGLLAILASIVVIAINPGRQLGQANNTQRRSDTNAVLNAVWQYAVDNNGTFPAGIDAVTASSQVLGTAGSGCDSTCGATTTVAACVDLSSDLVTDYLTAIPADPSNGSATNTDYYINENASGQIVVGSCDPDNSATINFTR